VEIRRTKQTGGHLPSAARTNTVPVLFRHYLRGDPTVTAWAEEVIGEAIADAEAAALTAHEVPCAPPAGGTYADGSGRVRRTRSLATNETR
jgi:hypothetical protein